MFGGWGLGLSLSTGRSGEDWVHLHCCRLEVGLLVWGVVLFLSVSVCVGPFRWEGWWYYDPVVLGTLHKW